MSVVMYHDFKIWLVIIILAEAKPELTDDDETFTAFTQSTISYDDITTNTGTTVQQEKIELTEDTITASVNNLLNRIPSQLVEFQSETPKPPTIPPPRYLFDSSMLKDSTTKPPETTTTEDPEDIIKVVPIKRIDHRGVLDLIFPETRVKTFKTIFDSIKRILSHTFRR